MANSGGKSATVFVEAALDDSLRTVRKRLIQFDSHDRVYVLVRMEPGQFAVISAFGLRKLVNDFEARLEPGQKLLDVTLKQLRDYFGAELALDFFPPQPGVEQTALTEWQQRDEAKKYRNLLLLLKGGQPVDVLDRTTPGTIIRGYDLLGEAISRQALAQLRWIRAQVNSTVRYVIQKLGEIPQDQWDEAVILLKTGPKQFGVIAIEGLREAVEAEPVGALDRPLTDFWVLQKPARVADDDLDSQASVTKMQEKAHYVVVIQDGEPLGILAGDLVYRKGRLFDEPAAEAQPRGLVEAQPKGPWGQSVAEIQEGPLEVEMEQAREVLPRFEYEKQPYPKEQALIFGHTYQFILSIGKYDQARSELSAEARVDLPEFPPAKEGGHNLYVSLFSDDFDFDLHTQALWLPSWGPSAERTFQVMPRRRTVGAHDRAVLTVCIYFRCNVVQVLEMSTPIVSTSAEAQVAGRQWTLKVARTKDFLDVEDLHPKELSLVITKEREDHYLFTFSMDPDQPEAADWPTIRLGCRVALTRDDLTHLITKARRQMYNTVHVYDLLREQHVLTYKKATRALAQVGRQLHLSLFASKDGQTLAKWMEEHLPDGSTIQVVNMARDFVFPWSLVYTDQPWDDSKPLDVTRFWGWKYKITILTPGLLNTYAEATTEFDASTRLDISVGMYGRLANTSEQKEFFKRLATQSSPQVQYKILEARSRMAKALKSADKDMYYFFCHGYTEKIASDIQFDVDLTSKLVQMSAEAMTGGEAGLGEETLTQEGQEDKEAKKRKDLLDRLDDLFDVSDSWLRLTRGRLPLTMLKETVPERFSRHPLVFLNMCQSAQVHPSLSGGFVPFFIGRGARAVVGTECSMNSVFADEFAQGFLTRFFKGDKAGDILLALRRETLEKGMPLALAYTLYCDADLGLAVEPAETKPAPPAN